MPIDMTVPFISLSVTNTKEPTRDLLNLLENFLGRGVDDELVDRYGAHHILDDGKSPRLVHKLSLPGRELASNPFD